MVYVTIILLFFVQILAKRLQLSNPEAHLVINPRGSEHNGCGREQAIEGSPVLYLSQCYDRIGSQAAAVKKVIIRFHWIE